MRPSTSTAESSGASSGSASSHDPLTKPTTTAQQRFSLNSLPQQPMYRLSCQYPEPAEPGPPGPTYESIDVQNLAAVATTAAGFAALAYAESAAGTSDDAGGPDGSTGGDSNPTVTVPDNDRLYPYQPQAHTYYYGRSTGPIMPMSGLLAAARFPGAHRCLYPEPEPRCVGSFRGSHREPAAQEEEYDMFNAIFALISLTSHLCCLGATLTLAYLLWRHEQDRLLLAGTLAAALFPWLIVNIISLKWLLTDHRPAHYQQPGLHRPRIGPCGWLCRILMHMLLLGPILRYVDLLRYGVKSWSDKRRRVEQQHGHKELLWSSNRTGISTSLPRVRHPGSAALPNFEPASTGGKLEPDDRIDYYLLTVAEDRDTSLLSLLQSLMQGTVQMVLQLYSLISHRYLAERHEHRHEHQLLQPAPLPSGSDWGTECLQVTVLGLALFETSWSMAAYQRALRRASYDKRKLSAPGTVLLWLWHSLWLACRVLAVALFLHQFGCWLVPVAVGHWGLMTIWIMHQGTHFFDSDRGRPSPCAEYAFDMLLGLIYLVVFINLKDEPTRFKYLAFYLVCMIENVAMSTLWYARLGEQLFYWPWRFPLLAAVPVLFLLSLLAMQLYYWLAHPNGRPVLVNKAARCC